MQQLFYDQAPYHILYYPSQLDAYRTDHFGGWRNQPTANGTPLFQFGSFNYTYLTNAQAAVASPSASAPSASSAPSAEASQAVVSTPAPVASQAPAPGDTTSSNSSPLLLLGGLALVVIAVVGILVIRRGRASAEEE